MVIAVGLVALLLGFGIGYLGHRSVGFRLPQACSFALQNAEVGLGYVKVQSTADPAVGAASVRFPEAFLEMQDLFSTQSRECSRQLREGGVRTSP